MEFDLSTAPPHHWQNFLLARSLAILVATRDFAMPRDLCSRVGASRRIVLAPFDIEDIAYILVSPRGEDALL